MNIKDVVALETKRFGAIIGEVIELNDEWVRLKLHTILIIGNKTWNIGDKKMFRLSLINKIIIINETNCEYLLYIEGNLAYYKKIVEALK